MKTKIKYVHEYIGDWIVRYYSGCEAVYHSFYDLPSTVREFMATCSSRDFDALPRIYSNEIIQR